MTDVEQEKPSQRMMILATAFLVVLAFAIWVLFQDTDDGPRLGEASPDEYVVDVATCVAGDGGSLEADGTIENTTGSGQGFRVEVTFHGADGGGSVGPFLQYLDLVPAGSSANWSVTGPEGAGIDPERCSVRVFHTSFAG